MYSIFFTTYTCIFTLQCLLKPIDKLISLPLQWGSLVIHRTESMRKPQRPPFCNLVWVLSVIFHRNQTLGEGKRISISRSSCSKQNIQVIFQWHLGTLYVSALFFHDHPLSWYNSNLTPGTRTVQPPPPGVTSQQMADHRSTPTNLLSTVI